MRVALLCLVVLVCVFLGLAPRSATAEPCCPCASAHADDEGDDCCLAGPGQCACGISHAVTPPDPAGPAAHEAGAEPVPAPLRAPASLRTLPSPPPPTPPPIG